MLVNLKCPSCGAPIKKSDIGAGYHCPYCGADFIDVDSDGNKNPNGTESHPQNEHEQKDLANAKPIYKKWWFWLIVAAVVWGIIGAILGVGNESSNAPVPNKSEEAEVVQEAQTEKTTEETDEKVASEEVFTTSPEKIEMNPLQQLFASLTKETTANDVKGYLAADSELQYHEYSSNGGFNVSYGDGYASSRPRDRRGENLEITFTDNGTKLSSVEYSYYGESSSNYPVECREGTFYYRNQECSDGYEAIQLYLGNK